MTYDAVVVGGGAAGLSAALMLGRARRSVLLCDSGMPRNKNVRSMHGFISRDGTSPDDLLRVGRSELSNYPSVTLREGSVRSIEKRGGTFCVALDTGDSVACKRVLLATGMVDALPEIDGLAEFWGRGVWVCPFCDGWEIRDSSIAVYSKDRSGVDLAQELIGWTPHIDVCVATSSDVTERDRRWCKAAGVRLHEGRLDRISGTREHVRAIHLDHGETIDCDALFLAVPLRQASSLAIALGCDVGENGALQVDSTSQTSLNGVYAAGDAVAPVHQVIFAAASGAQAAMSLTLDLLESDVTALVGKP